MDPTEDLLRRVVTGDVETDSPEFQGACADSPELVARSSKLLALQRRLDRIGLTVEHGDAASHDTAAESEFERHVRRAAEFTIGRRVLWMSAAAAVVIAGFGLMLGRERGGTPSANRDRLRLGTEVRPAPNERSTQAGFWMFDWAELPFDHTHTFRLSIYSDAARLRLLVPSVETRARSWSPESAVEASWPDRIFYSLEVIDASGAVREVIDVAADRAR